MRWVLGIAVLACGVLLWLRFGAADDHARATARREWVTDQGDTMRILEQARADHVRDRPRRAVPAVVYGTVYDPYGRPVDKAEVEVLYPKPYRLRFTDVDGRYRLEFAHPGEYVVEASLTVDLAPQRRIVVVPASGQVAPVDFRLKQAGPVFGEVVVGQRPATHGYVDIEVGDVTGDWEYEVEATIENGFFSFPRAPPPDLPLRVRVVSEDGFMREPLYFQYAGERVDLGRLSLLRYPTLLVRMRLPDGTWAREVHAGEAGGMKAEERNLRGLVSDGLPASISSDSRVRIQERRDRTMRLVFWAGAGNRYRVVRDVDLVRDQLREIEVTVRAGPTTVRRRLTNKAGDPIRARFQREGGPIEESGVDGYFQASVPFSGVHSFTLRALHLPRLGWIDLPARIPVSGAFLLDADDSAVPCIVDLDGRILLVTRPGSPVGLALADEPSPVRWGLGDRTRSGTFGVLIRPGEGIKELRWVYADRQRERGAGTLWSDWAYPLSGGTRVRVKSDDLTVIDAR